MPLHTDTEEHSIWLLPAAPKAAELQAVVDGLAARFDLARFVPHMTLLGDLSGQTDATARTLAARCAGFGQISARVTAVARTESHFMSLFLDLDPVPDPEPLRRALARDLGQISGLKSGPFRPHVSLAYGFDAPTAADLAALERQFVGHTLVFRRAALAISAKAVPVEDWTIAQTVDL